MNEDPTIEYMRKCTAILLHKMDLLGGKVERLELLAVRERDWFLRTTRRWYRAVDLNVSVERSIEKRLKRLRSEYDKVLAEMSRRR